MGRFRRLGAAVGIFTAGYTLGRALENHRGSGATSLKSIQCTYLGRLPTRSEGPDLPIGMIRIEKSPWTNSKEETEWTYNQDDAVSIDIED